MTSAAEVGNVRVGRGCRIRKAGSLEVCSFTWQMTPCVAPCEITEWKPSAAITKPPKQRPLQLPQLTDIGVSPGAKHFTRGTSAKVGTVS